MRIISKEKKFVKRKWKSMFQTAASQLRYFCDPDTYDNHRLTLRVVLGRTYHASTGWFLLLRNFKCCYFCESSCLFYLTSFNIDFYVSKIIYL